MKMTKHWNFFRKVVRKLAHSGLFITDDCGRSFCQYMIVDISTEKTLISGNKWRNLSGLTYVGRFFCWSEFRFVYEYQRYVVIKGRTCLITYWTMYGRTSFSVVWRAGLDMRLRGQIYNPIYVYGGNNENG